MTPSSRLSHHRVIRCSYGERSRPSATGQSRAPVPHPPLRERLLNPTSKSSNAIPAPVSPDRNPAASTARMSRGRRSRPRAAASNPEE